MLLCDFLNLFDSSNFRIYLHYDYSNNYDNVSKDYLLSSKYSKWKVTKIISFWENYYVNEKIIEIIIEK